MILQKVISFVKGLEDPKYPLLGPNLKGLYVLGFWQCGSKFQNGCYNLLHFIAVIFVLTQVVELWFVKDNFIEALHNLSVTALSVVCVTKLISFVAWQSHWKEIVTGISEEELSAIRNNDAKTRKLMKSYTNYARIVTYLYWNLVVISVITMIVSPYWKYITTPTYREEIRNGTTPYPQIISSWFPFDNTKMPGYSVAVVIHLIMNIDGGGVVAVYDSNAVTVMVFLKGQMIILKEKCRDMFKGENITRQEILNRIKECHRHHNFLIKHNTLFNSLLSPVMFLYVLVCSIMICCSVVQLSLDEVTASQKLWVLEYTTALVSQLFLYCWHCNEVNVECNNLDRGVFESDWWKADLFLQRQLVLLAGKLRHPFVLKAGPFTKLCIPTFIDIMKGSYSFYTLFSQMQEKK